ncbi:MAG: 4Fe-4S binding protein [Bacteroidota bacterium]
MKKSAIYPFQIIRALRNLFSGLGLSFRHLKKGYKTRQPIGIEKENYFEEADQNVTIQYPKEKIPVPDVGRYRLHMETDDCIVCDKCARICPVDCIEIESFKAVDDLGYTSDGSKKRLELPVFDIDMAKCCYCGLCTTVCPTECLTMTKVYDYSEFDVKNFIYHFGSMSPEEAVVKRKAAEELKLAKKRITSESSAKSPLPKPKLGKPKMGKPKMNKLDDTSSDKTPLSKPKMGKPKMNRPKMNKPVIPPKKKKEE